MTKSLSNKSEQTESLCHMHEKGIGYRIYVIFETRGDVPVDPNTSITIKIQKIFYIILKNNFERKYTVFK